MNHFGLCVHTYIHTDLPTMAYIISFFFLLLFLFCGDELLCRCRDAWYYLDLVGCGLWAVGCGFWAMLFDAWVADLAPRPGWSEEAAILHLVD